MPVSFYLPVCFTVTNNEDLFAPILCEEENRVIVFMQSCMLACSDIPIYVREKNTKRLTKQRILHT